MTSTFRPFVLVFCSTVIVLLVIMTGFAQQAPTTQPPVSRLVPSVPPDVAAVPADAQKSSSGLAWKVVTPGNGTEHPGPTDTVTVHYSGWTPDGRLFDSTQTRGRPSTLALGNVLPGWTEGVQLMVEGEKRRFWVPEALAFKGAEGRPKGMVAFDIELVDFTPAPRTPPDVAKVPGDAERTRTGLAFKILKPGTGTVKPRGTSTVKVHYSGWTTDGKMFDSSVVRGAPASFPLDRVIEGWTEGVQLMVEGEQRRFWIPENLAYKGQQGPPRGMLVFDIELIEIERR